MRVAAEQLGRHLEKGLQALYVVHGDEPLLAIECADQVRTAARRAGYTEREVFTVESGFDWSSLAMAGNNLSLFASLRLLDVRIPTGKPGTEGAQRLQAFCAALPPDTVTLVTLPKIDRQTQNSKWFSALEEAGVTVPVYPVERTRLPQWIAARLASQNQRADAQTLQFLADQVEGNLLAAYQEVQKLALLFAPGELTFEQVQGAVLDVARFDVFKLGDALLAGDAGRLARMLQGLQDEGEAPVLVLWTLTNEIRTLLRIKSGLRRGQPQAKLMREARVWESRQGLVERALKRVSESALKQALERAAELDRMSKGLAAGDIWDEMLQLAMRVAVPGIKGLQDGR
jgi:DNA polymerase III subunit delta